jgi:hypothetical protein
MEERQSKHARRYTASSRKTQWCSLRAAGSQNGCPGFGYFALVAEKLDQIGQGRQRTNTGGPDGWGKFLARRNQAHATGNRLSASAEEHFKKSLGHSIGRRARKRFAVMEAMKSEHPIIPNPAFEKSRFVREGRRTVVV